MKLIRTENNDLLENKEKNKELSRFIIFNNIFGIKF